MTSKEQPPLAEITSAQVYSKARGILDLYGHPGTRPTIRFVPRHDGSHRNTSGPDMPITKAPIVPIQIAGNDYRLWLRSVNDSQPDSRNGTIELSINFQQLPDGFDRVEYDSEGYVTDYWYKPKDLPDLKHLRVNRSHILPKELQFSWYQARTYLIGRNAISIEPKDVPASSGLEDSNDFLLLVLEEMQTKLKSKSV
jgi:hypothetical protein